MLSILLSCIFNINLRRENFLLVQWLRLCTFVDEGPGSIPSWRTKILQAAWSHQNKKYLLKVEKKNITKIRFFFFLGKGIITNLQHFILSYKWLNFIQNDSQFLVWVTEQIVLPFTEKRKTRRRINLKAKSSAQFLIRVWCPCKTSMWIYSIGN